MKLHPPRLSNLVLLLSALLIAMPAPVLAADEYDDVPGRYDQVWYDPRDYSATCSVAGIVGSDLPTATLTRIKALQPVYTKVATEQGVPWQLIAALDYRESGNDPNRSMLAGERLGTPNPDHPEVVMNTKEDSVRAAVKDYLKPLAKVVYDVTVSTSMTNTQIIQAAVAYNRGSIYKTRNIAPDLSPYAMNNYDDQHTKMVWPPGDPLTERYGTTHDSNDGVLTVYVKLGGSFGETDSTESCGGLGDASGVSANGNRIVEVALAELRKNVRESPNGCNCGGQINLYTDHNPEFWCADFVSWVYKTAGSPFTGGSSSGGWRIPAVVNLVSWFKRHGQWQDNGRTAPDPPLGSVIWFNYGSANGDTGSGNHTGIIVAVRGTTLITVEGNSSNSVRQRTYTNFRSNSTIQGWGWK
jgi:hypothetical protein